MSSIDQRIVDMKFNNGQFEQGVRKTLELLSGLKKALNLDGAKKSIEEVDAAGKKFSLENLGASAQGVSAKFVALATVAITALSRITNSAITAGTTLLKSLTIDPIKSGLEEYETQLNSVQTILANTQSKGSTLKDVNSALAELNLYADQTIYNFAEMARNIGTFTAAGVGLSDATAAIKGIANLAAVSGSSSMQASTAMYQLSQAISTGTVKLMDWNSVVNAGMGGELFQTALMDTARHHGVAVDEMIKKNGSFRDSLQEGWLSSEILVETLNKMTGDLTDEQLKSMGYTSEQIRGIQEMAKTASDAATKVKTVSQLIGTLQEAAQSGWAQTWQIIFGDFEEAKALFTSVNDVLGAMIGESADARNQMMQDWKDLGGRAALIEAIKNTFDGLLGVLKPIKEAFREIFPATTGKQLMELTDSVRKFTENFKMGGTTAENLKRTFKGVFAALNIGKTIIMGVASSLMTLVKEVLSGVGGFLEFTGGIGDYLVALDQAVQKGDGLTKFFEGLGKVLAAPVKLLKAVGSAIKELFFGLSGADGDESLSALDNMSTRLEPLRALSRGASKALEALRGSMDRLFAFMKPFTAAVGDAFSRLGTVLMEAFSTGNFSTVLDTINTGLFAAIALALRKFLSGGINIDMGGGLVESIKEIFGGLTDTLGAMQAQLKAGTLVKIAGALALLTASVVALSLIDSASLTKALSAITVMFLQLLGAMAILDKVASSSGVVKMPFIAASMGMLAAAVLILSAAVRTLSGLSWEELAKGLSGVVVLLGAVAATANLMSGVKGRFISAGVGMIAIAVAIKVLASAVNDFAGMDWGSMSKGLVGVGTALAALGIFSKLTAANKMGLAQSAGLVLLAGSLKIIASAVGDFAGLSWGELAKGLVGMAGALLIIAGAMALLPPTMIVSAAGLVVVAGALVILQSALQSMGGMSWEEIGKGLVVLAGSLLIIALAMIPLVAALPGAAALLIISAALSVLAPVLIMLGGMSWAEIGMGLAALAGALTVLGLAALVLTPVIPAMLGLGAAITLIGVGTLAAGAGILAFSMGLTALGAAGAVGAAGIVAMVSAIIGLIPMAMTALGQGIVAFAKVISGAGPTFVSAMTTLVMSLLTTINKVAPKIIDTMFRLIMKLVTTLSSNVPKFVDQGLKMVTGILRGIASNIGGVVTAAVDIVVNFINGIASNISRVIQAAVDLILAFINGLTNAINNNQEKVNTAVRNLVKAMMRAFKSSIVNVGSIGSDIVRGVANGIRNGASMVSNAARDMARNALNAAKNLLGIHSPSKEFEKLGKFSVQGFAKGLRGNKEEIQKAYADMKTMLRDVMKSSNEDVKAAEEKLKKLTSARKKDAKAIAEATKALRNARSENKKASATYRYLTQNLRDEKDRLRELADQYDNLTTKLEAARSKLADAQKTRDDYDASITSQYSGLGDITAETKLDTYLVDLKKQIEDTQEFTYQLQQLRKAGLNDKVYKELLAKGTAALPFVNELVSGGKASVDEINSLSDELDEVASKLGDNASKALYQAGVDAAQGLVEGLKKEQKALDEQMERLADRMVNRVKKRLGIKSPSRVFAELGGFTATGFAKGVEASSSEVAKAANNLGDDAYSAMSKALANVGERVSTNINVNPTIRPVLDLSEVKKEASNLNGMLRPIDIPVKTSYAQASQMTLDRELKLSSIEAEKYESVRNETNLSFTQNISSPKAISAGDAYRQTKNLLSVVKGGLPT